MVATAGNFDLFYSLEPEKKERIIRAALEEFGEKGYRHASTNAIVEKAGIGKGMLFYYFGSKEELFEFLCGYVIETTRSKCAIDFNECGADFIERMKLLTRIKRRTLNEDQTIIRFAEKLYHPENADYSGKYIREANEIRTSVIKSMYEGIDYNLFREGVEPEKIIVYLQWMIDSYEDNFIKGIKSGEIDLSDPKRVADEWRNFIGFINDLKILFYKEEYHAGYCD